MSILFVLKINRLQTVGNGTENVFAIDAEHLFCFMASVPLSKVKPNGVFRWILFLLSSDNSYVSQKPLWGNRGCFTTGCHAKPTCL